MDAWCSGPKGSSGFITIFFITEAGEKPVWSMNFGGYYPKEVILFLKKALRTNIERREFNGGRGPAYLDDIKVIYRYHNRTELGSSFKSFRGVEQITDNKGDILGYHNYSGMLLI